MDTQDRPEKADWSFKDFNERSGEMAKVLRNWFVGYGIGGPVLFFSNESIANLIMSSPHAKQIIYLFFIGLGLQIFNAFLIKWLTWLRAEYLFDVKNRTKIIYRFGHWFHKVFEVDLIIDFVTILCFLIATYRVLSILE